MPTFAPSALRGLARSVVSALALVVALPVFAALPAPPSAPPVADARLTATARALASSAGEWARIKQERGQAIEHWRDSTLTAGARECTNLVYPFSGPDFLNAYLFFPRCDRYVLFGLELPGEVPPLASMSEREAAPYLRDMRVALQDFIERNYFITQHMSKQLHTPRLRGVLPLVLASMGLLDLQIARIEYLEPPATMRVGMGAAAEARSTRGMRGVRVDFFDPVLGKAQTLYYFSLDATDVALRKTPEFLEMLAAQRPATTFIKSASYLLHGPHFARTRDVLLDITDTFVQDDTGVPYRLLREQGWDVRLYGEYAKPVRDFGRFGYQADLEAAYRSPRKPGSLPFPFGYRGYSGVSTLLVAHSAAKAR